MKIINKTKDILRDNSGETLVEVLVAFTLLSIMLLIFAQGISFATSSERRASESRKAADDAMILLQKKRAGLSIPSADGNVVPGSNLSNLDVSTDGETDKPLVRRNGYTVTVDGNTYQYYVYEVSAAADP